MKKILLLLIFTSGILFAQTVKNYSFDTYSYYEIKKYSFFDSTKIDFIEKKVSFSESSNPNYILNIITDENDLIKSAVLSDIDLELNYFFSPKNKIHVIGLDTTHFKTQNIYEFINKYTVKKEKFNETLKRYNYFTYTKTLKNDTSIYEIVVGRQKKTKSKNNEIIYIETQKIKNQLGVVHLSTLSYFFYSMLLKDLDSDELITAIYTNYSNFNTKQHAFTEKLISIQNYNFQVELEIPIK